MSISADHLDAVVAGLLSVNNYRVEAAWELLPRLRNEGLLDVKKVVAMDSGEVARRLVTAGYNRGGITDIVAPRLQATDVGGGQRGVGSLTSGLAARRP